MDISYQGKANFRIKTKQGFVVTDSESVAVLHKGETGKGFVISEPGEYEIEGMSVFAYKEEDSTIYVIQAEDIRILHLANLNKALSEKTINELENIDVVIVPTDNLAAKAAVEIIGKIEPYYVLPYGEGIEKLITVFEHSSRKVANLPLSKISLSEDLTEVIVFEWW